MLHYRVTVNGQAYDVTVEEANPASPAAHPGPVGDRVPAASQPSTMAHQVPAATDAAGIGVRATLPGIVAEIRVKKGQEVHTGDVLLLVEAMKMANEVLAPANGRIMDVNVKVGDAVRTDQVLLRLE